MNTIKNIHKLADILSEADIEKLDKSASLHKRLSNITFKVIDVSSKTGFPEFTIRVEQGKSLSGNYADSGTLIQRTRELFFPFIKERVLFTHPVPYKDPIVESVDTKWIADKMLAKGIRIKDIEIDTGISKSNISNWINGTKPMSQIVKAMFYFYFTR